MRTLRNGIAASAVSLTAALFMFPASAAHADVITPPGACDASGTWVNAGFTRASAQYNPSSVIAIPQTDRVEWVGRESGKPVGFVGPRRPIDGKIQLAVPFGVKVTIYHWGGSSVRYSNQGHEHYNLPSVLVGVKLRLSGYEKDSGQTVCSGAVYMKVSGGTFKNPLGWVGIGGAALASIGLLGASFRKTRPSYDDLNPS